MMFPLVRELAGQDARVRVPVSVTCRVLKLCRAQYYRWLAAPVTEAELAWAYRANALFDAHRDDPAFGYRYLAEEAAEVGSAMSERTAWAICSQQGWWSTFGKKRSARPRPGPPVHDDRLAIEDESGRTRHDFTSAAAPNRVWLTDIPPSTSCREVPPPSIGLGRASSTCARSRTPAPGGSWATASTHG